MAEALHPSVVETPVPEQGGSRSNLDTVWQIVDEIKLFVATDTGRLVAFLLLAMGFTFFALIRRLPEFWFNSESYFSHGILVPFLSLYILYDRRAEIAKAKPKPMWWVLIPLAPLLYLVAASSRGDLIGPLTYSCVITMFLTLLAAGGWEVFKAVGPAVFFLVFALPFGRGYLDTLTLRFQGLSTDMAFNLLKILQIGSPMRTESTQIVIGDYTLYVAPACSGLKLTISVIAFVALFMIVGRLKWWANLILVASVLPICIMINGLRIAMIGGVGYYFGAIRAGQFHDWSGYISVILCFFLLMKLTQMLGWK